MTQQPSPQQPQQPQAPGKPWYKKKRIMIPIGVVVALIAIGAAGGGSTDAKDDAPSADPTLSASEQAAKDAKAEAKRVADAAKKAAEDAKQAAADAKEEAKRKAEAAKKAEAKKPVVVDAATLIKAFEDNELAADAKYKGKVLRITGVIDKIDTEMFDSNDYTLLLAGGGDFELLHVTAYDVPNKDISKLSKGQRVTVICDFKDGGDLGVDVNHCKMA